MQHLISKVANPFSIGAGFVGLTLLFLIVGLPWYAAFRLAAGVIALLTSAVILWQIMQKNKKLGIPLVLATLLFVITTAFFQFR